MSTSRALFVDDEPSIIEGLSRTLFPQRSWLVCDFASSGSEALEKINGKPYDIVVTDMRMPGMDGAELLTAVAERAPEAIRIVLTGQSELEAALRGVKVAHHFLTKPTPRDELIGTLKRSLELRELTENETLRRLVTAINDLPTQPALFGRLVSAMDAPAGSLKDVASLVSKDVAIASKVLQVANSGFFSRGIEVQSVEQAVPRLGFQVVKGIVLAAETYGAFGRVKSSKLTALSQHSLEVAQIAKQLASTPAQGELAFTAGLLHDVGKLVLMSNAADSSRSEEDLESELGATHSDVGAYLLAMWGIPYPVVEAVAFHHVAHQSSTADVADCIRVAELVSEWPNGLEALEDFMTHHGWSGYAAPVRRAYRMRKELRSQ
ncbi:MAG: response regulator [Myxococcota bacterium]